MVPAAMVSSPLTPYLPIAAVLLLAAGLAVVVLAVTSVLGPRRPSAVKSESWECGSEPIGNARQRFAVKFYVVALLFIVFDVEAVFLYPWAVNFVALGWFGYVTMLLFATTLAFGLIYVWKKGALEWES